MNTGLAAIPTIELPEDYFLRLPSFMAQTARELGPVFKRRLPREMGLMRGEWLVYMVGPEANRYVLQSHRERFSHDQGWTPILTGLFEQGLLNTDDPEHARQRKLMNPAFAVAYMNRYLPIMRRIVAERTGEWVARGVVDLYAECRKITFDVAAEALVGLPTGAERDRLRRLFYQLLGGEAEPGETEQQWFTRIVGVRGELDAMLLDMIGLRRREPGDDILGLLVRARDEDGDSFSDRQILGQLHILLVAGHETSTTLSAWLLYLLATHPAYLARVQAELAEVLGATGGEVTPESIRGLRLLGRAIDETGRLRPPVGNVPRGVIADAEFAGYTIPRGTHMWLSLAGCHYLPEIFPEPESFDPDRFAPPREEDKRTPYSLVTFGGGPRICIGINFAQIEIRALAAHVLQAYTLQPVEGHEVIQAYYGVTAALPNGMPVRVTSDE